MATATDTQLEESNADLFARAAWAVNIDGCRRVFSDVAEYAAWRAAAEADARREWAANLRGCQQGFNSEGAYVGFRRPQQLNAYALDVLPLIQQAKADWSENRDGCRSTFASEAEFVEAMRRVGKVRRDARTFPASPPASRVGVGD